MNKQSHIGRSHQAPSVPTAPASGYSPVTEAGASPSKMPCLECGGDGSAEYMALDAVRPHWADCHVCDGTGMVKPYCTTCEEKLTVDLFCYACDSYAEGFEPVGWLKAETSAFGMGAK